jgi:hypothetical protein
LLKLQTLGSATDFWRAGGWPSSDAFQRAVINPLQFWMQFGEQWQKSWTETMAFWPQLGKPH